MTHPDVHRLQVELNKNIATQVAKNGPGAPGEETFYFGILTIAAVKEYQALHNLPTTGSFGPLTRAAIRDNRLAPWEPCGYFETPITNNFYLHDSIYHPPHTDRAQPSYGALEMAHGRSGHRRQEDFIGLTSWRVGR